MRVRITPRRFTRAVRVPASKSHTIRRLLLAALGEGTSQIDYPLDSLDSRSCLAVCRALGADIAEHRAAERLVRWTVRGVGGAEGLHGKGELLDAGNSGTTLFLAVAAASLGTGEFTFTGDEQIRRRSAAPLLAALRGLGADVRSAEGGCAPVTVQGPWKGGRVSLSCPTSQYLSALLIAAPLAPAGTVTEIEVPLLNERPYIGLTLSYLRAQGVSWEVQGDYAAFRASGGAVYRPMNGPVPGDFSSAAFPACAAAVSGGEVTLLGLDADDPQGDKAFFEFLRRMGCGVHGEPGRITVSRAGPLTGGEFDLNAVPDLLPVMAVMGAYAQGETRLVNAAHARIKETDRIAVMAAELSKLGVKVRERSDGLVIEGGEVSGGRLLQGHGDHRVAMALAVAALGASGPVEIEGAECAEVTYPGFWDLLREEDGAFPSCRARCRGEARPS
ncbi:MAG: 3-phosphoshikimate 1-carboxyvinyltransferase [Treponema sp.]|jgi:3-phosphoshikimate 1-carboxyvinyltransferase|nr:3-phosphoshikimate 1-carboxyvinyltransferase [Treponema sp.]